MDTEKIRQLLDARDKIDEQIREIANGTKERKPIRCSNCGEENHTARTCSKPKA